jgi:hypothetical protein
MMLSGWNCTPWMWGYFLCIIAMIEPSSVHAVTSRSSGQVSLATSRLWYRAARKGLQQLKLKGRQHSSGVSGGRGLQLKLQGREHSNGVSGGKGSTHRGREHNNRVTGRKGLHRLRWKARKHSSGVSGGHWSTSKRYGKNMGRIAVAAAFAAAGIAAVA